VLLRTIACRRLLPRGLHVKFTRAHCRQVLDLGLEEGDAVTGAALVDVGGTQRLVVLTKNKLLSYVLV